MLIQFPCLNLIGRPPRALSITAELAVSKFPFMKQCGVAVQFCHPFLPEKKSFQARHTDDKSILSCLPETLG